MSPLSNFKYSRWRPRWLPRRKFLLFRRFSATDQPCFGQYACFGFNGWNRPLSRRLDRCDRVIQNESTYPFGANVYYVTMQITFLTRKFRNGERNLHCDVVHITTKWVSSLTLDCNGGFAIKAYRKGLRRIVSTVAMVTSNTANV